MTVEAARRVTDVLDLSGQAPVDVAPLVAAVASSDVELGTFTDEELHWAAPDTDATPEAFIDAPRLARMDPKAQDVALATAMWMLQARGDAAWDGQAVRLRGVHAMLGQVRHEAQASASVDVQVRDGEGSRAAVYRVRPDLFVVEYVAPEGLHWLVCCSPQRAAARLASLVDPEQVARDTGPAQTAAEPDRLSPQPDALADAATTAAFVLLGEVSPDGEPAQRAMTVYGTGDGLFVYQGVDDGLSGATVGCQRLGPADLVAYCRAFLAPAAGVEQAS